MRLSSVSENIPGFMSLRFAFLLEHQSANCSAPDTRRHAVGESRVAPDRLQ